MTNKVYRITYFARRSRFVMGSVTEVGETREQVQALNNLERVMFDAEVTYLCDAKDYAEAVRDADGNWYVPERSSQ